MLSLVNLFKSLTPI